MARYCTQCGTPYDAEQRFCVACGHQHRAAPGAPPEPSPLPTSPPHQTASAPRTTRASSGRRGPPIVTLVVLGLLYAGLATMAGRDEGSWTTVAIVGAALAGAGLFFRPLLRLLSPWWALQGRAPRWLRTLLAFALPAVVGFRLGGSGGGREWTSTLVSFALGLAIALLLLLTPSGAHRRRRARG